MSTSTFWTRERRTALRTLDQHLADAVALSKPEPEALGPRIVADLVLGFAVAYGIGLVLAIPVVLVALALRH